MNSRSICLLTSVLMAGVVSRSFGQSAQFYRVASAGETTIVFLDRHGLLACTSSVPHLPCNLECARSPEGPWDSGFSYTVVATVDHEMTALVPIGPVSPPPQACCSTNVVRRVRDSILLGGSACRVDGVCGGVFPLSAILLSLRPPKGATFGCFWTAFEARAL